MAKRILRARDVERLENTSIAPILAVGDVDFLDNEGPCGATSCILGGGCTGSDCNTCLGSCVTDAIAVDTWDHVPPHTAHTAPLQ